MYCYLHFKTFYTYLKLILKLLQHVSVPLDHHHGARFSYPKVTTDRLLVRYTSVVTLG